MTQAAADRPPIAHGTIGDALRHARQHTTTNIRYQPIGDGCVRDAGSDGHRTIIRRDPTQFRQSVHLHQHPRLRETQVQHRPQRLPARQHPRPLPQQRDRIGQTRRTSVFERRRLHAFIAPATPPPLVAA